MRSTIAFESGPGIRSRSWCRSPVKVSDCQSMLFTSVSKILLRGAPERAINARSKAAAAGDMAIWFIA